MINQGWECPRCKTINAPFMSVCGNPNCKPQTYTITTDGTGPVFPLSSTDDEFVNHQNCTCPNCVPNKPR